jgi:hypothetical protein
MLDFLTQVISLADYLHLPLDIEPFADQHKEWHHFCIIGQGIQVIVNFSLMRLPGGEQPDGVYHPGSWDARVILLVREAEKDEVVRMGNPRTNKSNAIWDGDVDIIPATAVRAKRGALELQLGQNTMTYRDGCFNLSLALEKRPITLMAQLEPLAYPLVRRNTPIGQGMIHWVVVPRLAATGMLVIGQRVYPLEKAPAYHDHNWGHWDWGDDFSWQWGFALPPRNGVPWTVVFDQMTNRGRNKALELKLTLWKESKLHRLFMHEEIRLQQDGFLTMTSLSKFPHTMALVAPELTTDVPRRFEVSAKRDSDWLRCVFTSQDLAQLVVPDDLDLGVTIINEVSGQMEVEGQVKGEPVSMAGEGFFEFLT